MSRTGRSDFDSSAGNSGTTGGGGGTLIPNTFWTTQLPRFTGLVLKPGEFSVRNTAIGKIPPRPKRAASSTRTHVVGIARHFRHAVVLRQNRIHERVIAIDKIKHGAIV